MPASKAEQVLQALGILLSSIAGAQIERNAALPEKIPAGGASTHDQPKSDVGDPSAWGIFRRRSCLLPPTEQLDKGH